MNKKLLTAMILAGGLAMGFSPATASAEECQIKCETCKIDYKTGTAECSNCTVTGCETEAKPA